MKAVLPTDLEGWAFHGTARLAARKQRSVTEQPSVVVLLDALLDDD